MLFDHDVSKGYDAFFPVYKSTNESQVDISPVDISNSLKHLLNDSDYIDEDTRAIFVFFVIRHVEKDSSKHWGVIQNNSSSFVETYGPYVDAYIRLFFEITPMG